MFALLARQDYLLHILTFLQISFHKRKINIKKHLAATAGVLVLHLICTTYNISTLIIAPPKTGVKSNLF